MAESSFNWIVPLRRAVVNKPSKYRDFMSDWLEELRNDDHTFVLGTWYSDKDDAPFSLNDYSRGLAKLNHWQKSTFGETRVATNSVGVTTLQTYLPNFHARLWKGPKRVLREQATAGDPAKLADIQSFDLVNGQIRLQRGPDNQVKEIELLPGDVLEVPIHEFLFVCGQQRFKGIDFDPEGSFYLGTTVKRTKANANTELPRLHDNMLAMRFQLVTALNHANCYHDAPVYTSKLKYSGAALRSEGAGVFARGMPFGGNSVLTLSKTSAPSRFNWNVSQNNTNKPEDVRPVYLPTSEGLLCYEDNLPLTWGWVCSPYAIFLFHFMADLVATASGITLASSGFRADPLAGSICMATSSGSNAAQVANFKKFQKEELAGAPLLVHNLKTSDIEDPRHCPPLGDFCSYILPEGRAYPDWKPGGYAGGN